MKYKNTSLNMLVLTGKYMDNVSNTYKMLNNMSGEYIAYDCGCPECLHGYGDTPEEAIQEYESQVKFNLLNEQEIK